MRPESAIFAAGCFWGVEDAFRQVDGVFDVEVGYIGGHTERPSYKEVCSDQTGHAEAVRVEFDSDQVGYEDLLEVFWSIHDPTQVDRQGPDVGSQYRSAIFYTTEEQEEKALQSKAKAQLAHERPIATEVTKAPQFWRAEDYHQRYYEKHGLSGCAV